VDNAQVAVMSGDIGPGGDRAVLTLADGSHIVLDSAISGTLAAQGGVAILKEEGQLAYHPSEDPDRNTQYNIIQTPKGGQYRLILSDGTKIWLNANSSLKYPTHFTGSVRKVEMTGEVYFEVAHNKDKPFQVSVGDIEVEVLGTHFNIQAYQDEKEIYTTLIEGAVRVNNDKESVTLQPGQQSAFHRLSNHLAVAKNIDTEQAIAWKNGYFSFQQTSLQDVLRQLSRWYNVEIKYMGKIPERRFSGGISRNSNLSDVLKILEESNVNFVIEGNTLLVKP
jgi:ferric-dicitrate binding protein FerR (iron transport regulator)